MPVSNPLAGLAVLHSPASRGAELSAAVSPFMRVDLQASFSTSMPSGIPTAMLADMSDESFHCLNFLCLCMVFCKRWRVKIQEARLLEFSHASIEDFDCRPAGII